ncbi:MAG TPA: 1-deoxy-D-xylulose-5-phosphate reductoisomerase, partial [Pseudoalteromonas sp.]|nr:1-deoxy-D-xylulose-5-phosphate reductoisomerase [Pseudoalteromonas sp.]
FLNGKIGFTDIYKINAQTLEAATYTNVQSLDEILECDKLARISASEFITKVAH